MTQELRGTPVFRNVYDTGWLRGTRRWIRCEIERRPDSPETTLRWWTIPCPPFYRKRHRRMAGK